MNDYKIISEVGKGGMGCVYEATDPNGKRIALKMMSARAASHPDYKEMFRLSDGDKIRMVLPSGEKQDYTCRYVDETHLEVGRNLYHICEFAERMKDNGITVIPLRSSLPDKCFSYLESTGEMIVITKGEKGYTPTGIYPQDSSPKKGVAAANEANGVTQAQEAAMVAGSMFGWHVLGADPKNYDEHGQAIRPKAKDRDSER